MRSGGPQVHTRHLKAAVVDEGDGAPLRQRQFRYQDLMERGVRAFQLRGALQTQRLARKLRAMEPCMMCEMGLGTASRGAARAELIQQGRDPGELLSFADTRSAVLRRSRSIVR